MVINLEDKYINDVYNLGILYDDKFKNKFFLEDYLKDPNYIIKVYIEDNLVVGFLICTYVDNLLEIILVYVKEEYRNKKIAYNLINTTLEEYHIIHSLLEVNVNNEYAIKLYNKLNYQIINTRKKYYHGIDAYVMEMKK